MTKVGIIAGPHGIRGQVKIRSFIEPPEAIFTCGALTDDTYVRTYVLTRCGGGKVLIASIEGVHDRNAAEALKGTELFAAADALPAEYKLVGLEARTKDGKRYGRIIAKHNFGAGEIIEIELATGKTEMLPLDKKFVEVKDEWVLVHPPEYIEGEE